MFGIRIALLRIQKGLSQAELARRLCISPSAVGMYEQGRRTPSLELVVRLAQELDVTTDYLLSGDPENVISDEPPSQTAQVLRLLKRIVGK